MGAPTAKLETVVVVSPFKVLSLTFAAITILFLVVSVPASFWLHGENSSNGETNRFGLWKTCSIENSTDEASNETSEVINCSVTNRVWVQISASLILICIACSGIGIGLILAGFRHAERQERKIKLYQTAAVAFAIGTTCIVLALILFPVMLMKSLHDTNKDKWFFGWCYGLAWGATLFLVAAIGLLFYDRNTEEIFYKEKLCLNEDEEAIA